MREYSSGERSGEVEEMRRGGRGEEGGRLGKRRRWGRGGGCLCCAVLLERVVDESIQPRL